MQTMKKKLCRRMENDDYFVRSYSKNKLYTGKHIATKLWVGDYSTGSTFEEFAREAEGISRIGVLRADVDNLGHMHNISYLDAAYDVMPEEYFNGPQFNFVSIEYRKELLKNDDVKTHFYKIDNGCIISLNTDKINSVITLKY